MMASAIATNCTVVLILPSIDGSMTSPADGDRAAQAQDHDSRATMISAIHGEARPTATSAISTPETSSLSAVVSRNEPSVVVTPQRRARRPSIQSVAAATTNSDAGQPVSSPREDERHDHRRQQDPHVGPSGEQTQTDAARAQGAGLHEADRC